MKKIFSPIYLSLLVLLIIFLVFSFFEYKKTSEMRQYCSAFSGFHNEAWGVGSEDCRAKKSCEIKITSHRDNPDKIDDEGYFFDCIYKK